MSVLRIAIPGGCFLDDDKKEPPRPGQNAAANDFGALEEKNTTRPASRARNQGEHHDARD